MQAKENEHDLIKNQLNCVSIENAKLQAEIAQLIEKIRTLQIQIPHPHDKTHNETQTSEFFAEEYDNLQSKLIKVIFDDIIITKLVAISVHSKMCRLAFSHPTPNLLK